MFLFILGPPGPAAALPVFLKDNSASTPVKVYLLILMLNVTQIAPVSFNPNGASVLQLKVGKRASVSRLISIATGQTWQSLVCDSNPIPLGCEDGNIPLSYPTTYL